MPNAHTSAARPAGRGRVARWLARVDIWIPFVYVATSGDLHAFVGQVRPDGGIAWQSKSAYRYSALPLSQPAVAAPLRFWFPGLAGLENYPNYVLVDRGGVTCMLPMPFGKGVRLAMRNRGQRAAPGVRIVFPPFYYP